MLPGTIRLRMAADTAETFTGDRFIDMAYDEGTECRLPRGEFAQLLELTPMVGEQDGDRFGVTLGDRAVVTVAVVREAAMNLGPRLEPGGFHKRRSLLMLRALSRRCREMQRQEDQPQFAHHV